MDRWIEADNILGCRIGSLIVPDSSDKNSVPSKGRVLPEDGLGAGMQVDDKANFDDTGGEENEDCDAEIER